MLDRIGYGDDGDDVVTPVQRKNAQCQPYKDRHESGYRVDGSNAVNQCVEQHGAGHVDSQEPLIDAAQAA